MASLKAISVGAPGARLVAAFLARVSLCAAAVVACPSPGAAEFRLAEAAPAGRELSQFQLPPAGKPGEDKAPAPALPQRLTYEYAIGSESQAEYRRNSDLNDSLDDKIATLQPQVSGFVTYRPTDWLETTVELILERDMQVSGKRSVTLPSGEIEGRPKDRNSLLVDQAYFRVHNVTDPFALAAGRRNYEDDRHWLFDTSLDIGAVEFREGALRTELTYGREALVDLDALRRQQRDRINTLMLFSEYRAFEDIKFAGYVVRRTDQDKREGRWQLVGLRSLGFPTESLSYWMDAAAVTGRDQTAQRIRGYGFDLGATYRFIGAAFNPNVTIGYAVGSGDRDPNDNENNNFRQTGLQSNEQRFAGVSEFKYYGEALDPELSNLKILTLGAGFRPTGDVSVDFIYHRYWLDAYAEDLRSTALTAEINQDPNQTSSDVGQALDVVVGFRNVLGIRRLGIDLRGGLFFPGDAFRNEVGDEEFRGADSAAAVVLKIWL